SRDGADTQLFSGLAKQHAAIFVYEGEAPEDDVHLFLAFVQGVSTRPSSTSRPSSANASSTARAPAPTNWVLNGEDTALMIGDPRLSSTTKAAIVAMLNVSTVAMRTTEMIEGSARGSSTLNSSWLRSSPIPVAARRTSSGTADSPDSTPWKMMTSVKHTSAISTVSRLSPVKGTSSWNRASGGSV